MSTTMRLSTPIWISRATLAVLLISNPWEAPPVFAADGEAHPRPIEADASASAAAQRSRGGMTVHAGLQAHDAQARSLIIKNGAVQDESVLKIDELDVIVQLKGTPAIQMRGQGALAVESALQAGRRAVEETALEVVRLENRSRNGRGLAGRGPGEVVTRSYSLVFQGFRARVRRETLPLIERLTSVEKVWPDREVEALLNDSVPLIQANRVWYELGADGTGVRVAILDTGIDYTHPDLGGCLGPRCKVLGGYDFVNGDSDPMDDFGHGTHVAGIVAANGAVRGVAPGCKLLGYKVLNEWGWGSSSDIIAAIERATDPDGNPATDDGAHIINLSLGGLGDPDDPLCQAVDNAVAGGVVVVVAAGNSGPDYETVGSPGVARRALTVGATDKFDTIAGFSSRGPASVTFQIKPEIVAPGVGIMSTVPRGSCYLCDASGYLSGSGTSMATPHVAGAAALLLDLNPGWTPDQVRAALLQRSQTMRQDVFTRGSGRLDAHAAATSSALAVPPNSSLGLNDPGKASFSRSARITLKNISLTKQTYTLSVQGSFPPGVSASVSPSSLSIQRGRSKSFTLSVTVNNALTPNAPDPSFSYEGVVRVAGVGQTLTLPFAFLKTPLLTINFDQAPWFVQVRDGASFYRYRNQPGTSLQLSVPGRPIDVITVFQDAASRVVKEGLVFGGNTAVNVNRTDAAFPVRIVPSDKNGQTLALTRSMSLSSFRPRSGFDFSYIISTPGLTDLWFSPLSSNYTFDTSIMENPPTGTRPTYVFNAAVRNGIAAPRSFHYSPADFRRVVSRHTPDPGTAGLLVDWQLSSRPGGTWFVFGGLFGCDPQYPPLAAPYEEEAYLTPMPYDDFWTGYLRKFAYRAPAAPCETGATDFLYATPYLAASSPQVLKGYLLWDVSQPVLATSSTLVRPGIGPYSWFGRFWNSPGSVYAQTAFGYSSYHLGGQRDERAWRDVPFELWQGGRLAQSGLLTDGAPAVLSVAPGPQEMRIPHAGSFMGGQAARSLTRAIFDTMRPDPDPPYLTEFSLSDGTATTDLIPPTGGQVKFKILDNSGIGRISLYGDLGAGYQELAISHLGSDQYIATIPPFPGNPRIVPMTLSVEDTWGNSLTYSYCSPANGRPETCNGIDDDCDGFLPAEETDADGDRVAACAGDCNDTNASIWGTPGEVTNLTLSRSAGIQGMVTLGWSPPTTGGTESSMTYDVLRSTSPSEFVAGAVCVESGEGPDRVATDTALPLPGHAFFYLARARNACPSGTGTLGTASGGQQRAGRSCP